MRPIFRFFCITRFDRSSLHKCWNLCDFGVEFKKNSHSKIDSPLSTIRGAADSPHRWHGELLTLMRGGDLCLTKLYEKSKNLSHYHVLKIVKTPAQIAYLVFKNYVTSPQGSSEEWRKINWIRNWDHLSYLEGGPTWPGSPQGPPCCPPPPPPAPASTF